MRKKISVLFLLFLLLTGCTKLQANDKFYTQEVKVLQQQEQFDQEFPFEINISIERLTKYEITYHLVIDHFEQDVNNIKALVIHDQKTDDVYPSIGIYEEKVDLVRAKKKGILLVGYIDYSKDIKDFKGTFKAMISYTQGKKEITKFYKKQF